ncbi:hypothetical protein D9Q98_007532 [Chlorella vulgaris]|uniref:Phosphoglycerate mutase n=1 Tax=Chlorella vulgaris TaxID=3077 RepID=A0A9D4TLD5_CHLVU|nr:hypothetical protein D9Q98_007532 [Chlorella vulgaris]
MRAKRAAAQDQQRSAKALKQMGGEECELVLVRHGETPWNVEHRLQGQLLPGPGLTERGRHQAEVLAKRLQHERFHRILSSDLLRAVQTAELVAAAQQLAADGDGTNGSSSKDSKAGNAAAAAGEGAAAAAVETDPSLRERCLGALQGLTLAQAAQQQPLAYAALHTRSHSGAPPRGAPETLDELDARVTAALDSLAVQHPGQRLLVVTHGGFLHAVQKRANGGHVSAGSSSLNAAIHTIRIEPPRLPHSRSLWAVVRWGDVDHLGEAGALASGFGGGSAG